MSAALPLLPAALSREGLMRAARSLSIAYIDGSNQEAREGALSLSPLWPVCIPSVVSSYSFFSRMFPQPLDYTVVLIECPIV